MRLKKSVMHGEHAKRERQQRTRAKEVEEERGARRERDREKQQTTRARETAEEPGARRAHDRERQRRMRDSMTTEELEEAAHRRRQRRRAHLADLPYLRDIANRDIPLPFDTAREKDLLSEGLDALWGDQMSKAACVVCDELVPLAKLTRVPWMIHVLHKP